MHNLQRSTFTYDPDASCNGQQAASVRAEQDPNHRVTEDTEKTKTERSRMVRSLLSSSVFSVSSVTLWLGLFSIREDGVHVLRHAGQVLLVAAGDLRGAPAVVLDLLQRLDDGGPVAVALLPRHIESLPSA